jgi:hypothetical protein
VRILKRSGFLKLWARPTCSGDPSFALSRFNGSDESFEYFGKRLRIVAEKARQTRAMDRKFAKDRRCRCERLGAPAPSYIGLSRSLGTVPQFGDDKDSDGRGQEGEGWRVIHPSL